MNNSARDWVISWPNLEGLISEGNSFRMLIAGGQNAWISFDAIRTELAVEIEQKLAMLPAVLPQAISIRLTKDAKGSDLLVLATASVELRRYFYDFAVEVLELVHKVSWVAKEFLGLVPGGFEIPRKEDRHHAHHILNHFWRIAQ